MAISFVASSGSASATVVLPPGIQAGDYILLLAHKSTTTSPSSTSGYTSITSFSGNSNSGRISYKIATGSESGTSVSVTNATTISALVYRGTSGIGTSFSTSTAASTTQTLRALTPQDTTGQSWVVEMAASNQIVSKGKPANATLRTTVTGTADMQIGVDSNGPVTTWGSATSSNGASAVSGYAQVELLGPNPDFSTLIDPFNTTSIDTSKWTVTTVNGSVTPTTSGVIETVTTPSASGNIAELVSNNIYNLINSYIYINIAQSGGNSPSLRKRFVITDSALTTGFGWQYGSNSLDAITFSPSGGTTSNGSLAYNPTLYAWLRLRADNVNIYYDTSSDGITWTNQTQSNTVPLASAGILDIRTFTTGVTSVDPTFQFSNLNTTSSPPTSTTTDKAQAGILRIKTNSVKTQQGILRIYTTTSKTINGQFRILSSNSRTQSGVLRIRAAVSKIQTGILRVKTDTTVVQSGRLRIQKNTTVNQTALFRVQKLNTVVQNGQLRITGKTTQTQNGTLRIGKTTDASQSGVLRITGPATIPPTAPFQGYNGGGAGTLGFGGQGWGEAIQPGTVVDVTRTQSGMLRIYQVTTQTTSGIIRVKKTNDIIQSGVLRIKKFISQAQPGILRIKANVSKNQSGVIRIGKTTTNSISGVLRIKKLITQTQNGILRIAQQPSRTQNGILRIRKANNANQSGRLAIAAVTLRTQSGYLRIKKTLTQTISGRLRILTMPSRTITGMLRIKKTLSVTQLGKLRIAKTNDSIQSGRLRIKKVTSSTQHGQLSIYNPLIGSGVYILDSGDQGSYDDGDQPDSGVVIPTTGLLGTFETTSTDSGIYIPTQIQKGNF